jgi:hypothetical protein
MEQSGMVKKNMKKIEFKKIVTTALIAVMGLFALVAMKPMYKNFPAVGILTPPPTVTVPGPGGGTGNPVITVINNSTCTNLSFDLGFKAQQNGGAITNESVFPNRQANKIYYESDFNGFFGTQIDYSQPFNLVEGGIDISIGTETKLNLKPGENKHWDDGTGSTAPCQCFNAVWNEATKTITISDC